MSDDDNAHDEESEHEEEESMEENEHDEESEYDEEGSIEEFESERPTTRAEAAAVLRGLADGVDTGAVSIGEGDDAIVAPVPDEFNFEVEYEHDDDEVEIEVELEWSPSATDEAPSGTREGDEGESDEAASDDQPTVETATVAGAEESVATSGESTASEEPAESGGVEPAPVVASAAPLESLGRFELYQDRASEWRWRLVHRNGNIIASSGEGYTRKHNAEKGMRSVMRNAPDADVVEEE